MEAGVHTNDLLAALGRDDPLPKDVAAATATVIQAFFPVLAAQASEVPPEGTTVAFTGRQLDVRFGFAGGPWHVIEDHRPPTATISAADDSTIMLFALGRLDHPIPASPSPEEPTRPRSSTQRSAGSRVRSVT